MVICRLLEQLLKSVYVFKCYVGLLGCCLCLLGCATDRPTQASLPILQYPAMSSSSANTSQHSKTLMIFLPGRTDAPDMFEKKGLIQTVQQRYPSIDAWVVDAHFGYYTERILIPRMQQSVLHQARQLGYEQIWLVGVSIGGFGVLLSAAENDRQLTGLILIAPYLGNDRILANLTRSADLAQWQPPRDLRSDDEAFIWPYLQRYRRGEKGLPKLYLLYGTEDRFAPANDFLAKQMPAQNVWRRSGKHDWSTWQALWQDWVRNTPERLANERSTP